MSLPVAFIVTLLPALRVLPVVVSFSVCDEDLDDCDPIDALTPMVLLFPLSELPFAWSSATAWPACTPDSAACVPCRAARRESLLCCALCAVVTALFTALPAAPDSATVSPLLFCSNVSSRVRLSCPGSITTLSPVRLISFCAMISAPPICACLPAVMLTLPPVEPTVLKLSLWVVPFSRRSWVVLLLPMVKPMPPVPIRPDFLVSLKRHEVSVLVAATMSTLLPPDRATSPSPATAEPKTRRLFPADTVTLSPLSSEPFSRVALSSSMVWVVFLLRKPLLVLVCSR
ncbi:hypothetical protein ENROMA047B_23845 [Enterobacter rongchengensis]